MNHLKSQIPAPLARPTSTAAPPKRRVSEGKRELRKEERIGENCITAREKKTSQRRHAFLKVARCHCEERFVRRSNLQAVKLA